MVETVFIQFMYQNTLDHLDRLDTIGLTGTACGPVLDMVSIILTHMALYLVLGTVRYLGMLSDMDTTAILDIERPGDMDQLVIGMD